MAKWGKKQKKAFRSKKGYLGRYTGYGRGTKGYTKGGGRSGGGGGGSAKKAPTIVKDKATGKPIVYTAGGKIFHKKTDGTTVTITKSKTEGWSAVGKNERGTIVWQKDGKNEFLETNFVPLKTQKGAPLPVKGKVYVTSNKNWVPKAKDATVIYITKGGKTTGQIYTSGAAQSGKFSVGVYKGYDVTRTGDMKKLGKIITQEKEFQKYYTQQKRQERVTFLLAQKKQRQEAIQKAIRDARATYERRLTALAKRKYQISDTRWDGMTLMQQKFYKDKYLLSLKTAKSEEIRKKRQKDRKARYAHTLGERLSYKKPPVSFLKGTSLRVRLGR